MHCFKLLSNAQAKCLFASLGSFGTARCFALALAFATDKACSTWASQASCLATFTMEFWLESS